MLKAAIKAGQDPYKAGFEAGFQAGATYAEEKAKNVVSERT